MLAFRRGDGLVCVVNFTDGPLPLPDAVAGGRVLIASRPDAVDGAAVHGAALAANSAVWCASS